MEEKSREEVLAERKLRKQAKQAKKQGANKEKNPTKIDTVSDLNKNLNNLKISSLSREPASKSNDVAPQSTPVNLCSKISETVTQNSVNSDEKRPEMDKKPNDKSSCGSSVSSDAKTKAQLKAERRAIQVLYFTLYPPTCYSRNYHKCIYLQEAQRNLKAQKKVEANVDDQSKSPKSDVKTPSVST